LKNKNEGRRSTEVNGRETAWEILEVEIRYLQLYLIGGSQEHSEKMVEGGDAMTRRSEGIRGGEECFTFSEKEKTLCLIVAT